MNFVLAFLYYSFNTAPLLSNYGIPQMYSYDKAGIPKEYPDHKTGIPRGIWNNPLALGHLFLDCVCEPHMYHQKAIVKSVYILFGYGLVSHKNGFRFNRF